MGPEDGFLFDDEFTEDDWHESILKGRTDSISADRSSASVTIDVDFDQYKSACQFILGYSWVDDAKSLRRQIAAFHPVWTWLMARSITGVEFKGPTGTDQGSRPDSLKFGTYTYAEITIDFGEIDYQPFTDDDVAFFDLKEYERFVSEDPTEYTELFQVDGGQMRAYAPSVAAVNGQPYIAAPYILARTSKSAFNLTWRYVPKEFIYNDDGRAPKLADIQKKVNSADFLGRTKGTLLCENAKAIKKLMPIATDVFDQLRFYYDVVFEFKEFNPDPGDLAATVGGDTVRGWNLFPGGRATGVAANSEPFGWYYFTSDGTATGNPMFRSYDFASAFTHWSV